MMAINDINSQAINSNNPPERISTNKTTQKHTINNPSKGREAGEQISQATASTPKETLTKIIKNLFQIEDIYKSRVFDTISDRSYQSIRSLCDLQENNPQYLNILEAAFTVYELSENIENISEAKEPLKTLKKSVSTFLEEINTTVLDNLKTNQVDIRNTLKDDTEWINFLSQIEKLHQTVLEVHSSVCKILNTSNNFNPQEFNLNDLRTSQKKETDIFKITNRPAIERFQEDQNRINEQVIPLLEHCGINAESLKPVHGVYNILSLGAGAAHDAPAILKEFGENSKYYAVDIDQRALKLGRGMTSDSRIEFVEKDISDQDSLYELPKASLLLVRNPQFCPSNNFSYHSENASGTDMVKLMLENGLKKLDKNAPILFTTDNVQEHSTLTNLINTMPEIDIIKIGKNPNGGLAIPSLNIYPGSEYVGGRDQYFIFCNKKDITANLKTPPEKAQ